MVRGKRFGAVVAMIGFVVPSLACKREVDTTPPPVKPFSITAEDNCVIAGTSYPVSKPNAPAIILLHAQGGNRGDWEPFALRAQRDGYCVVAPDIRGHGDSACAGRSYRAFEKEDWLLAEHDVRRLKQKALDDGCDPNNIFLAGAGIGANLALRYALTDPQIQAAVLFSPGESYLGVSMPGLGLEARRLPILVIAAEGDSYSAQSAERLHRDASGYTELRLHAGTAFGTDLLVGAPESANLVFRWLRDIWEQ